MPVDNPLFWLLAVCGVLFTGISKSGFAGGAGVIAVPLLALVIDVPAAAALMLPLLLVMDIRTIAYYRREANWRELKLILPGAFLGIVCGGMLLGAVPPQALKQLLGIMCLVFAGWQALAPLLSRLRHTALLWGGVSGLASTLIHAGGPPINIYLIGRRLSKAQWLATAGLFFGFMNLLKVVPYSYLGQWQSELLLVGLALIPVALLGVKLGNWIQHQISEQHFLLISRIFLAGSGLLLLLTA